MTHRYPRQETEKKHGAGKGNWGSTEDEVQLYVCMCG